MNQGPHLPLITLQIPYWGSGSYWQEVTAQRQELDGWHLLSFPCQPSLLFTFIFFHQPHILQSSSTLTDIQSFVHHRIFQSTSIRQKQYQPYTCRPKQPTPTSQQALTVSSLSRTPTSSATARWLTDMLSANVSVTFKLHCPVIADVISVGFKPTLDYPFQVIDEAVHSGNLLHRVNEHAHGRSPHVAQRRLMAADEHGQVGEVNAQDVQQVRLPVICSFSYSRSSLTPVVY
jgi:hypothetical protein